MTVGQKKTVKQQWIVRKCAENKNKKGQYKIILSRLKANGKNTGRKKERYEAYPIAVGKIVEISRRGKVIIVGDKA